MTDDELDHELTCLNALEPLRLVLTRVDCLLLLSLLQLALRHPEVRGAGRELGMKLGDTLENAVSITPHLRALTLEGWTGIIR